MNGIQEDNLGCNNSLWLIVDADVITIWPSMENFTRTSGTGFENMPDDNNKTTMKYCQSENQSNKKNLHQIMLLWSCRMAHLSTRTNGTWDTINLQLTNVVTLRPLLGLNVGINKCENEDKTLVQLVTRRMSNGDVKWGLTDTMYHNDNDYQSWINTTNRPLKVFTWIDTMNCRLDSGRKFR